MNGKSKCRVLKEIRREIAKKNEIDYVVSECRYQGECSGTCPKCEAELRYLEEELSKRRKLGKAVAVAGIAATLLVSAPGCTLDDILPLPMTGDIPFEQTTEAEIPEDTALEGEMEELMGEPVEEKEFIGAPIIEPTEMVELMGDIAYLD